MGLGKQAKIISKHQQSAILSYLKTTRSPDRNCLIFMLSVKAGLRAKEIASLKWSMVLDCESNISDSIRLEDTASKGKSGGVIWLNTELKELLNIFYQKENPINQNQVIIKTERSNSISSHAIVNMFRGWYQKLGYEGCSSHSGRRTFITNSAKKISSVGGSIRDVQILARHSSLQMTQRYIESDIEAQKKVVQII